MKRFPLTALLSLGLLASCSQPAPQDAPLSAQNVSIGTEYGYDIDVNQNGAINVKGVSIFPVGFYYVPYGFSDATLLNDLNTIKAGGFNFVHIEVRDATREEKAFLTTYQNRAQTYAVAGNPSMYVAFGSMFYEGTPPCQSAESPFTDTDSTGEVYLHKYQRHPAFFSYKLADDTFTDKPSTSRCTPERLQARASFLNNYIDAGVAPSLDPTKPDKKKLLSITGSTAYVPYSRRAADPTTFNATWAHYANIFKTADVIGVQAHSGLNAGASSVVYYSVAQAVEVAQSGEDPVLTSTPRAGLGYRSVWAEPMVLDRVESAPTVPTSANKIGVESWASIAAGAKGLLWYAYREKAGVIPAGYFDMTKRIAADLRMKTTDGTELSNVILNGTRRVAGQQTEEIYGTSWEYNGKKYLLVVNTMNRVATGNETILDFRVQGTKVNVLATTSSPRATTGPSGYDVAPWPDPRGVVLRGTLPAQSATFFELN